MIAEPGRLPGVWIFRPRPVRDERGLFTRTFDAAAAAAVGIDPAAFVQDSQSRSGRGAVRGLHGRSGAGEAKLVRVAHGSVLDVVVDARPGSAAFGRHQAVRLDDVDFAVLYVPRGLLHGFQVLSSVADVCYRIDRVHDPLEDVSVHHADPDLAIHWPLPVQALSERDRTSGSWADLVAHGSSRAVRDGRL